MSVSQQKIDSSVVVAEIPEVGSQSTVRYRQVTPTPPLKRLSIPLHLDDHEPMPPCLTYPCSNSTSIPYPNHKASSQPICQHFIKVANIRASVALVIHNVTYKSCANESCHPTHLPPPPPLHSRHHFNLDFFYNLIPPFSKCLTSLVNDAT